MTHIEVLDISKISVKIIIHLNVTKEFWDMLDYYKEKFKHAAAHTKLPDEPNKKEIDKLLIDMYEMVL